MIFIFDLDGTVIDTSHRYRNKPCGTIDLDYWFAHSTPEMIARDALLPLANEWRRFYAATKPDGSRRHTIVVCTARSWERHPLMTCEPGPIYERFLADNDLRYDALLYRNLAGADHETLSDGELKTRLLNDWAASQGLPDNWRIGACMFDDNTRVIRQMVRDRLYCFDAVQYNARLERKAAA